MSRSTSCCILSVGVVVGLVLGCGSKFTSVSLDRPPDEYRSTYWTHNTAVEVEKLPDHLRCTVKGKLDPGQTPYGGIMVPGEGAKGLRLDMAFTDPQGIVQVFVDGFNASNERTIRWQTDESPTLRSNRWTYVLLPHQDFEEFKSVASPAVGPVETFHVFVHVKPGALTTFDFYGITLIK